jgi:hypothetical protein
MVKSERGAFGVQNDVGVLNKKWLRVKRGTFGFQNTTPKTGAI